MPTDLPPDYVPTPKPKPGEGKPDPAVPPVGGVDAPAPAGDPPEPGGDVVDPPGWVKRPDLPGIDPQEVPSPAGTPVF